MGSFDSIFLYTWFGAQLFIISIGSIYFLANNAHPNDTAFAKKWLVRVLTWLGFTLILLPLILMHLDVTYNKN
jgi:hypothetical protein